MKYPALKNYIDGKTIDYAGSTLEVISPLDGSVICTVPVSGADAVDKAAAAAKKAFPQWSSLPIRDRAQVFYRYKYLLEKNMNELAELIQEENGKTISESIAEVEKSIEVTEFACSLAQIAAGEILEVSKGVECRIERYPLGVVASITPFNFPTMVPNWTIPNALVLGNCMILKPSELVPLSANRIAELLKEAGLPDGVFNVVHGTKEVVEAICDHPAIEAVSFVGSTKVAKIVYARAASNLKRALTLGGAKNHLLVLPDANVGMTASNVAASMSGCAGQRCMAASAMVAVGSVDHIIKELVEEAKKIVPGKNLGSVISKEAKERIENYITEAEKEGARILLDGRNCKVEGKENGFYVGPTVIDFVKPEMRIAKEEVFGPVLSIIRTDTVDNALSIQHGSLYGNAASVFTQNGGIAKYISEKASAGMIGVNIGVPVPREPFSFGGWNDSKFGTCDITGKSSVEFWTKLKKTTVKWNPESQINWMS
ncbi:MAG: methylmalonate-semialdehyde dehydrogenase (CoA acylating) [Ignavibacteriae bacterium HGW-Ignavibacteriae-3]|nr:MAG: methylmalonate-semialdehyde dehydrogenase (CoA acylating) [Ignavibacteriae bacterium HGW-Ignavibacteriae-3]